MGHVRFTEAFDFTPKEERRVTFSYKAGHEGLVRKDCADQAIAAGKALKIPAPPKKKADALDHDGDGRKGGSAPPVSDDA